MACVFRDCNATSFDIEAFESVAGRNGKERETEKTCVRNEARKCILDKKNIVWKKWQIENAGYSMRRRKKDEMVEKDNCNHVRGGSGFVLVSERRVSC